MTYDFSNQVVVVTGATGNLGQAVAHAFQESGARLALIDLSADRLRQAFPDLADVPDHYLANCADLTDSDSVNEVVRNTIKRLERIDVLIHTVGGYRAGKPLHETPLNTWRFMIALNAGSTYITCQAILPHMLQQGRGKIVTVGARPGLQGSANAAAYSAAKSATIRLTESMAAEYKDKGINVNCILPGTIDTPQNREATPEADFSLWVTPESLAEVILFLCSEAARDIHGAAIPVYGRS
jgi:NAD(P)-dependent dehydrogenase (short-subunit alcohol dehydrogenase family)